MSPLNLLLTFPALLITEAQGHTVEHAGGISGFGTHILRIPHEIVWLVVLSNFEFVNSEKIANELAPMFINGKED